MQTMLSILVLLGLLGLPRFALGAPGDGPPPTERPEQQPGQPPPRVATYGLCDLPQNAEDFPSSPVPVKDGACETYQEFTAMSPNASYGGSCGGYTVVFGPLGDLKLYWKKYHLKARWADTPPTTANCAQSRLAAVAWGWRCDNPACTAGAWERIGKYESQKGTWNAVSKACYLDIGFVPPQNKVYNTLNLDVIATQTDGQTTVRKRAGGWIYAKRGNHKCFSATVKPR